MTSLRSPEKIRDLTELESHTFASKITGILIEKGASDRGYSYHIDDQQIFWPAGSSRLYKPDINRPIELIVSTFSSKNPENAAKLYTMFSETINAAVVLEFKDSIHMHNALSKYGLRFLKKFIWNITLKVIVFFSLSAIILYSFPDYLDAQHYSLWINICYVLLVLIWAGLVLYFVQHLYLKLAPLFNLPIDTTSIIEKLKG